MAENWKLIDIHVFNHHIKLYSFAFPLITSHLRGVSGKNFSRGGRSLPDMRKIHTYPPWMSVCTRTNYEFKLFRFARRPRRSPQTNSANLASESHLFPRGYCVASSSTHSNKLREYPGGSAALEDVPQNRPSPDPATLNTFGKSRRDRFHPLKYSFINSKYKFSAKIKLI